MLHGIAENIAKITKLAHAHSRCFWGLGDPTLFANFCILMATNHAYPKAFPFVGRFSHHKESPAALFVLAILGRGRGQAEIILPALHGRWLVKSYFLFVSIDKGSPGGSIPQCAAHAHNGLWVILSESGWRTHGL